MDEKPDRQGEIINEEHVLCKNCMYQFSYLYVGKEDVPADRPFDVLRAAAEKTVAARKPRYKKLAEAYHCCPNCGFLQPWMLILRRGLHLRNLTAVTAGALAIEVLLAAFVWGLAGDLIIGKSILAACTAMTVIVWLAGMRYLMRIWNPNKNVDTESYGGAVRVTDVRVPANWDPKVCLSMVPSDRTVRLWLEVLVSGLLIVMFVVGCIVFVLPLWSQDLAYYLQKREAVMVPFWAGVFLTASSAILFSFVRLGGPLRLGSRAERVPIEASASSGVDVDAGLLSPTRSKDGSERAGPSREVNGLRHARTEGQGHRTREVTHTE